MTQMLQVSKNSNIKYNTSKTKPKKVYQTTSSQEQFLKNSPDTA